MNTSTNPQSVSFMVPEIPDLSKIFVKLYFEECVGSLSLRFYTSDSIPGEFEGYLCKNDWHVITTTPMENKVHMQKDFHYVN